ncbi:ABC transporter G family member 6-like [Phragmites australis]|uniref:ABC transporter G family member 6-like n=1 Tax=Phragmites australis TaxID=29695 RepID=UPI002D78EAB1|nr:ABC transporter G family member 6-like [Phragmites australis]
MHAMARAGHDHFPFLASPPGPPPVRERDRSPSLAEMLSLVGAATVDPAAADDDGSASVFSLPVPVLTTPGHGAVGVGDNAGAAAIGRTIQFRLAFTNLTYSVRAKNRARSGGSGGIRLPLQSRCDVTAALDAHAAGTRVLLDGISGEAREGEILAVMGASGSGKSTLIDGLANRISRDALKGAVTLNGEPLTGNILKSISAYVMQDDLLFPMLTVTETLSFAAEFRLPRVLSPAKKRARVQALIEQLGLSSAANTIIGDEGHRGVSGGERRRVSIGTDIIHDPILLFLDEPTSGLDSTSAFMVVKVLRCIAESGSIVITSIHQPSQRILGLLDRLILLSGGRTVFSGTPSALPSYFAEFNFPIPDDENRAEFALDLIREFESSPTGTKPLVDFHRTWQRMHAPSSGSADADQWVPTMSLKEAISASISRGKLVSGSDVVGEAASVHTYANPFWVEMKVLTKRSAINTRRMPELFLIRLGAVVVTGSILATVFFRLDQSPKGAQERLGFFAFSMSTMFYTCADALPVFLQERYVFLRETAYGAYRRASYVLSNAIVSFPPLVVLSLAFAFTTFFAVGLAGGASGFAFYTLAILASFWAGSGFVTFLSGVIPHVMIGYTVVVAILAYFLLFSGFFINRDRIPSYWIWFHYLSLVKYPFEGVLQNEFGRSGECFARGAQIFDSSPLAALPDAVKARLLASISSALGVGIRADTCVVTGPSVLQQAAVTQLGKWECLLVTAAWGFLFRLFFYFSLVFGSKNKRR